LHKVQTLNASRSGFDREFQHHCLIGANPANGK
jgi:hypothetical protein